MVSALIGIESGVLRGMEILRKSIGIISENTEISGISSVTRSVSLKYQDGYEDCYNVVLKISCSEAPDELIKRLMHLEQFFLREYHSKNFRAVLLAYSDVIHLVPHLVLPHPQLVQDKSFLIGAIEVWPQYLHPILEKPLTMLSSEEDFKGVEFVSPGKNIII